MVSIDLYSFNNPLSELSTLGIIPMFTGGQLHTFRDFDPHRYITIIFSHGLDFYYALQNGLTRHSGSSITIRSRINTEFSFKRTSGKFGFSDMNYITLPWAHPEDYFIFNYTLERSGKGRDHAYAQFVLMFDDCEKRRLIRVFNVRLTIVPTISNLS